MPERTPGLGPVVVAFALFAGAGASAAERTVTMSGSIYGPEKLAARVGDVLVFDNDDDMTHAVFVPTVGHAVDLGTQKGGEKRSLVLRRAGRFEVECVLHEDMKMVVEVAP
jgi:plastocyanin